MFINALKKTLIQLLSYLKKIKNHSTTKSFNTFGTNIIVALIAVPDAVVIDSLTFGAKVASI